MQNIRILIATSSARHFSIGSVKRVNYASREARFMGKLLQRSQPKKKKFNVHDHVPTPTIYTKEKKPPSIHTTRRMQVLNKVFMERITDLMATGEVEPELLNRGIEVSHVNISPDFKIVNVYWVDHDNPGASNVTSTEQALQKCASQLRHELSQLRVIGCVPPLKFVKSKQSARIKEIERMLRIADYGADYEPSLYQFAQTQVVTYAMQHVESENSEEPNDMFSVVLPVMKNDVFGLDHDRIMSKITASLNKSRETVERRALNICTNLAVPDNTDGFNVPKVEFMTAEEQRKEFREFLNKKQKEGRIKYKRQFAIKRGTEDYIEENVENDVDDNFQYDFDDYEE